MHPLGCRFLTAAFLVCCAAACIGARGVEDGGGAQAAVAQTPNPCGDGVCSREENCNTCMDDCGSCSEIRCLSNGGVYCGGNGVGGDPNTLYICERGFLQVKEECGAPCQHMPSRTPDVCPKLPPIPESLVTALSAKPSAEQDCKATTFAGWPHPAQQCTLSSQGKAASVTVANPPAAQVARWIVDAVRYLPSLDALRNTAPAAYEEGLGLIAKATLAGGRAFPLAGSAVDGQGALVPFKTGVPVSCGAQCGCRMSGVQRKDWCDFRAFAGGLTPRACLEQLSSTAAWADECLRNHAESWTADVNPHFRAQAYSVNWKLSELCRDRDHPCSPEQVLDIVKAGYGLSRPSPKGSSGGKLSGSLATPAVLPPPNINPNPP